MHHIYPISKGDQLCPLGFHPQVRWPTRCKRCFRDYKEHGGKRNVEDVAASTPNLAIAANTKVRDDKPLPRSWTSSQNLSTLVNNEANVLPKRPVSWTSTPDLDEKETDVKAEVTISIALPKRRHTATLDEQIAQITEESVTIRRPPLPPSSSSSNTSSNNNNNNSNNDNSSSANSNHVPHELLIHKTDSLAERVRKMQILKRQQSQERETGREQSREKSVPRKIDVEPELPKPKKSSTVSADPEKKKQTVKANTKEDEKTRNHEPSAEAQFLIQVKNNSQNKSRQDDNVSMCTDTTEATIIGRSDNDLLEQIESLKRELELTKSRCERAERDKSDILLRRLASMDTVPNKTAASEALKLQQKVNELTQQVEDYRDERKCLSLRVRELEQDLNARPTKNIEDELRNKLQAAETLCEELMDENEDMKRDLRNMEQEMDEMHDNFREDQADEYSTVKKELDQTTKNCRILSFKLKKSERKIESLEADKQSLGAQASIDLVGKVNKLEEELRMANEIARRLQAELDQAQKSSLRKKTPALGIIGKSTSADGKISRESLTRGGSQEDPIQLLRDLQDSMEREADLREQLKFAEEEAESIRKKSSRVEDENESLVMQLKKMATKARSRKLSPSNPSRLTPEPPLEKDEGISDEEDPAELRLLLELNEQEAAVLRRKVEELETENETKKKQIRDLHERMSLKTEEKSTIKSKLPTYISKTSSTVKDSINEKKIKILEEEMTDLRKKVIEKERAFERLRTDYNLIKGRPKSSLLKSKSLESPINEQQSIDIKRQMQVVEQEASVLRTKVQTLEQENEGLATENKKLSLQAARTLKKDGTAADKAITLELTKAKDALVKLEKECDELTSKLKKILEDPIDKLPTRQPKKVLDLHTKLQTKKMVEELEEEITEMRAIILRTGGDQLQKLETEKAKVQTELKDLKIQLSAANSEIKSLKGKQQNNSTEQTSKVTDLEDKIKKITAENDKNLKKMTSLEEAISKNEQIVKQSESANKLLESQLKKERDNLSKLEKDLDKEKKEKTKLESKVTELDGDLQASKKNADKSKTTFEKEIASLKTKAAGSDAPSKKVQELKDQAKELEASLTKETKKYTDLTAKYELLEEEHVLTKAQLTTEKEKLDSELVSLKQKLSESQSKETKSKDETNDLTRKLNDFQAKITELEKKSTRVNTLELEKNRLKGSLEEKDRNYAKLKKENEMNLDVLSQLKKESDELRQKLDDFDRVNKVQRTLNDHNSSLETEVKKLKLKLENTELSVKSEVAATRLRYEQQVNNMQNELTAMQGQCERFKRDRDAFKQLLEGAQKAIGELKQGGRLSRTSQHSGDEDDKSKIITLEQTVGCLEDELSEARLEASKVKTELISEKSASEIKISEMQSRLNEYEEERLLGTGRTKIPGTKTRLELSWQKEREEMQRLLQETSTLARDLRQTLFEVERERDKERLESRRKLDQTKRGTEEEMEEGRKKISELQCDLLELRDAHAKLRTANEKLRRERERFERERDSATKRRMEQDGDRKVGVLLQTVDELVKIAPDLQMVPSLMKTEGTAANGVKGNNLLSPTAPRRSKSRSPSPGPDSMQISTVLARLAEASEELRRYQRVCEDERDRERVRRSGMRRAASTEGETPEGTLSRQSSRNSRSSNHNGSLYRKSLSLDQSMHQEQHQIWKTENDSMSSMQSIDSELGGLVRDSSLDSRLSGGSTQSDMPRGPRKKKRGLMGKLRSLTKMRSTESDGSHQGSDSDISMTSDHRSSKPDLKHRLSGMFRRSGSNSRGNSMERIIDPTQRPVAVTTYSKDGTPLLIGATLPKPPTTTQPVKANKAAKPPTPSGSVTPSGQRKIKK